jgi:hypothetical protein
LKIKEQETHLILPEHDDDIIIIIITFISFGRIKIMQFLHLNLTSLIFLSLSWEMLD